MSNQEKNTTVRGVYLSYLHLLVGVVSMFWLTPVILNHLGKVVYGFWAILNSILEYFRMFDFGLNTAVSKYTAEYRALNQQEKLTRLVSTALMAMLVLGGLITLVCFFAAPYAPTWFDVPDNLLEEGRIAFIIMGINVAFMLISGVMVNTVYGFERVDIWKLFGAIQLASYTLFAVACVYLGIGLVGILLASLASTLVLIGLYILFLKRSDYPLTYDLRQADMATLKEIGPYSLRTFSLIVSSRIQYFTDNIVLGIFLGAAMVGPYEIAYKLCFLTTYLFAVFSSLAFPKFSRLYATKEIEALQKFFLDVTKLCVAVMCGLSTILLIYGEPFIDLWVGHGNFVGYQTFIILISINMIHAFASPAGTLLQGIGENRGIMYSEGFNAGLNLIFSIILVQYLGWVGVALGTILAQMLTSAWVVPKLACKYLDLKISHFLKFSVLPPVFAGVLTGVIGWFLKEALFPQNQLFYLGLNAIIFFLIFALIYVSLALDTDERAVYKSWLVKMTRRKHTT